jgi:hypothetical protein
MDKTKFTLGKFSFSVFFLQPTVHFCHRECPLVVTKILSECLLFHSKGIMNYDCNPSLKINRHSLFTITIRGDNRRICLPTARPVVCHQFIVAICSLLKNKTGRRTRTESIL